MNDFLLSFQEEKNIRPTLASNGKMEVVRQDSIAVVVSQAIDEEAFLPLSVNIREASALGAIAMPHPDPTVGILCLDDFDGPLR